MIRVAQMLLARVLYLREADTSEIKVDFDYFASRDERSCTSSSLQNDFERDEEIKQKVIRLFLDNLTDDEAPFSIQNFVEHAFEKYQRFPGDWYGTSSASNIIESLNSSYKPDSLFKVVIFTDHGIDQRR